MASFSLGIPIFELKKQNPNPSFHGIGGRDGAKLVFDCPLLETKSAVFEMA